MSFINENIYVDIEINKSNFNRVKLRNYLYGSKTYSMLLETGKDISNLEDKYFWQLNLNTEDRSIDYGEDVIVRYSLTKQSIYMNQDKIVLKFLEYYRNLYYTDKNKLDEAGIWLAGLTATTFKELYDIYGNILDNDELSILIGDVIRMSKEDFNIHEWEKEKMDALVKYNYYKDGREENLIDIIKEMFKNNASIDFISKVTKKSEEELLKIKGAIDNE